VISPNRQSLSSLALFLQDFRRKFKALNSITVPQFCEASYGHPGALELIIRSCFDGSQIRCDEYLRALERPDVYRDEFALHGGPGVRVPLAAPAFDRAR
jgi:hypothetical protein